MYNTRDFAGLFKRSFNSIAGTIADAARLYGRKSALVAAAFAVAAGSLPAAHAADSNDDINLSNENLIVILAAAHPFVTIKDSFHHLGGLDVALINELQRRTGFKNKSGKYEIMSFGEMIQLGRAGLADVVAGAITSTEERGKYYTIAEPYVYNSVVIVTRAGDRIKSTEDLNGRTLAIQTGTNISGLTSKYPNIKTYETPSTFMTFYAVSRGLADALIIDEIIAREYIGSWPDCGLDVSAKLPDSEGGMALLFKKDSPYTAKLMKAYQQMIDDGTVKKLVEQELRVYFSNNM